MRTFAIYMWVALIVACVYGLFSLPQVGHRTDEVEFLFVMYFAVLVYAVDAIAQWFEGDNDGKSS